eukprot:5644264-Amphidinium_carterae.4
MGTHQMDIVCVQESRLSHTSPPRLHDHILHATPASHGHGGLLTIVRPSPHIKVISQHVSPSSRPCPYAQSAGRDPRGLSPLVPAAAQRHPPRSTHPHRR